MDKALRPRRALLEQRATLTAFWRWIMAENETVDSAAQDAPQVKMRR